MRSWRRIGVRAMALACLCAGGCASGDEPRGGAARVVLVLIDTLRRDHVGAYGGPVATPHIDALAEGGERVEEAFSAYHMTSMSMGAIFTGHVPSIDVHGSADSLPWNDRTWCGLARFARSGEETCIPSGVATLGERMRDAGYETIGVVSNALLHGDAGFARGFGVWAEVAPVGAGEAPERGSAEARQAAHVLAATRAALDARTSDRFFLYVHFMDVHDYGNFNEGRSPLDFRGLYADAVRRQDAAVGQLVAWFAERGLLEGTTFVLTSDHGERLGERHVVNPGFAHAGNPSYDYLVRVPLIVSPRLQPGLGATVHGRELHALLLRIAGVEIEAEEGEGWQQDELYVSELEWRTLRRGRWKRMSRRDGRRTLLYDLEADPAESRDLTRMQRDVERELQERSDSLARALAAPPRLDVGLDSEERSRLRALGYAD